MALAESIVRFLETDHQRLDLDGEGGQRLWGVQTRSAAVLIVAEPTDALKETSTGRIHGSLDRAEVWEVAGLCVSRELVEAKPASVTTVTAWIEWLADSGVPLEAIEKTADL